MEEGCKEPSKLPGTELTSEKERWQEALHHVLVGLPTKVSLLATVQAPKGLWSQGLLSIAFREDFC